MQILWSNLLLNSYNSIFFKYICVFVRAVDITTVF